MKKTLPALCLAVLLTVPMAGCSGGKSSEGQVDATQPPIDIAPASPSSDPLDDMIDNGTQDLAGPDGIVGGSDQDSGVTGNGGMTDGYDDATGTDAGSNGRMVGRADDSTLGRMGRGIMDSMEDLGTDARTILDDMGDAARQAGQEAKRALK